MAISKDITIKILGNQSQLNESIYVYEKDNGVVFNFTLMEYKYKYDKDPDNVLNSNASDILEAYTTIVNPLGQELEQLNGEVIDDVVKFTLDKTYTDQLTEIGIYKLQIHIKCTHAEFSIPPITFEVLERLKGKSIADSAQVDITELQNNVAQIDVVDGILNVVWQRGDIISSTKLNQMTAAINNNTTTNKSQDNRITLVENELTRVRQVYVNVEGSNISTDSSSGYLKDVEILGNTIQDASNLEDIRSVGDKVEGQELYEIPVLSSGKNLFDKDKVVLNYYNQNGTPGSFEKAFYGWVKVKSNTRYTVYYKSNSTPFRPMVVEFLDDKKTVTVSHYTGQTYTSECSFSFTTNENTKFVCLSQLDVDNSNFDKWDIQLEEGTIATPYEPYVEDKLTILSPVQLERVGDVADRIIEKDGVWGVEKNVITKVFDGSEDWYMQTGNYVPTDDNYSIFYTKDSSVPLNKIMLCDKIPSATVITNTTNTFTIGGHSSVNGIRICIEKSKLSTVDLAGFREWLQNNPITVKHSVVEPIFIPLPHDQQIKLRTFANKTNISFLTEIEGTIKAQVPKSLGATVNTHTEQISNLNKELDRVKKLEESTVSTVTTESDFTTVEATSNGYFEDVKLEGKTLVNILPSDIIKNTQPDNENFIITSNWLQIGVWHKTPIKPNTTYTIIVNVIEKPNNVSVRLQNNSNYVGVGNTPQGDMSVGINVFTSTTTSVDIVDLVSHNYLGFMCSGFTEGQRVVISKDIILLEGDHTQNPPSYFEGLKSVGQDVDEIVVSSVNGDGNLVEYIELNGVIIANGKDYTDNKYVRTNYIIVEPNQTYYIKLPTNVLYKGCTVYFYDSNKSYLGHKGGLTSEFTTVANTKFIRLDMKKADGSTNTQEDIDNCDFVVSKCRVSKYIPHQSDKKRLLYYNDETQAWEKPVLREWDSIEKHSDGKYYYHQRSGEAVFNGSEDWIIDNDATKETSLHFRLNGASYNLKPANNNYSSVEFICDKFTSRSADFVWCVNTQNPNGVYEGIAINTSCFICVRVLKSKLSTQDIQGFKQWLQANNVTVVYQLAQEKVYECTNIDLITYANETNYIVESGAIVPKTALKVHNNISNVVRELQQKVSTLEQNESKFMQILRDLINK